MNAAVGQCPILLINLASSVARLEEASRSLAAEGLAFERIEAVDGRLLDATQRAALAPDNRGWFYQPLTPGEIGCFMSHLVALRAIVARGWQVAAVFEDDFSVRPGLAACLRELASEPAALFRRPIPWRPRPGWISSKRGEMPSTPQWRCPRS